MDKVDLLVNILLDQTASVAERDDAAIDLGKYNDDRSLNALISVVSNPREEEFIMDVAGESIARIWVDRNQFDLAAYKNFHHSAKSEVKSYIKSKKPEWLKFLTTS